MNARDSYLAVSINAKKLVILINVSSAIKIPSKNADVVKTQEWCLATQ
jgi:hypothetical protein